MLNIIPLVTSNLLYLIALGINVVLVIDTICLSLSFGLEILALAVDNEKAIAPFVHLLRLLILSFCIHKIEKVFRIILKSITVSKLIKTNDFDKIMDGIVSSMYDSETPF